MAKTTSVIAFRLPDAQAELMKRDAERKGLTPAEYMRRLVVRQLARRALSEAAQTVSATIVS